MILLLPLLLLLTSISNTFCILVYVYVRHSSTRFTVVVVIRALAKCTIRVKTSLLYALYSSSSSVKSFGKVHYQGWDVTALRALQ